MKENGKTFLISKDNKTIPGIKKLLKAEQIARSGISSVAIGIWCVDGIPYDTCSFTEAQALYDKHREDAQRFKELNERINARGSRLK